MALVQSRAYLSNLVMRFPVMWGRLHSRVCRLCLLVNQSALRLIADGAGPMLEIYFLMMRGVHAGKKVHTMLGTDLLVIDKSDCSSTLSARRPNMTASLRLAMAR